MDLKLKGAKVLISGGTRGIGLAIVETFLSEGATVGFCSRNEEDAFRVASRLGSSAFGASVDVTKPEQVTQWVDDAAKKMGGVDIIVPNVSALASGGSLSTWRSAFETDLLGTVNFVNAALPSLRDSTRAAMVFISSVSGREVDMFAEPYGVMKSALIHYGKTLSARHAAERIRVNTVSPGNVYFPDGVWGKIERETPELFSECLSANPSGRMASPQEVANAVVFLASPASSFTTGTNLLVDGGLTVGVQY